MDDPTEQADALPRSRSTEVVSTVERVMIGSLATVIVLILMVSMQRVETGHLTDVLIAPPEDVVSVLGRMESDLGAIDSTGLRTADRGRLSRLHEALDQLQASYVEEERKRRKLKGSFDDFKLLSRIANVLNVAIVVGGFLVVRWRATREQSASEPPGGRQKMPAARRF